MCIWFHYFVTSFVVTWWSGQKSPSLACVFIVLLSVCQVCRAIESGLGSSSSSESRSTMGGGSPPLKEGLKTKEGYRRGEKLRTPVPGHLTFFTFVLATFFLLFLFLFIYFPLPPSFFFFLFWKEKKMLGFFLFFFLSSPFFSWIETHISPFFECEEVPYLRVVLSPASGILALSPLQYK